MPNNYSLLAQMAEELTYDSSTGNATYQSMGTLDFNPAIIIFDNQSTVAVQISNNGTTTWRTFPAGEGLVLDLRGNHGIAANFTFKAGTELFANSAAGAGNFSISYIYPEVR